MNLEQAAAAFVAKHRDDRIDVDHINGHFGSVEKYLESIAEYETGGKTCYVEILRDEHIDGRTERIEWTAELVDDLKLQNDELSATIEKLKDQLKLTEARRARDADKLETISSALISIIEDGINDMIDARLGAAIESAVESEMDSRDLLPRDDFDDMFNDALSEVDINLSR